MIVELLAAGAGALYVFIKGISEQSQVNVINKYRSLQGYNFDRQRELEHMVFHDYPGIAELAGRHFNRRRDHEVNAVLRSIARREGWTFYNVRDECDDPAFRYLLGSKGIRGGK